MKFLLVAALLGLAYGRPTVIDDLLTKRVISEEVLDVPISEVSYDTLLPVVKETVTKMLHVTIPEECVDVVIPRMVVGLTKILTVNKLRDLAYLMNSKTIEETLVLEQLETPITTPYKYTTVMYNVLNKLRERVPHYRNLPLLEKGVKEVAPTEIKMLEIYEAIVKLYMGHINEIKSLLQITEVTPFEKVLYTIKTMPTNVMTFRGMTLRMFVTMVTDEMKSILTPINPSVCLNKKATMTPLLLSKLREFVVRMESLCEEDIMVLLPTRVFSSVFVKPILTRVLPLVTDTTSLKTIITSLTTTTYRSSFMHLTINTVSECLVTDLITMINTERMVLTSKLVTPEVLIPLVTKMTGLTNVDETAVTKQMTTFITRLCMLLRAKRMPVLDMVDLLTRLMTPTTRVPEIHDTLLTSVHHHERTPLTFDLEIEPLSWETTSHESTSSSEEYEEPLMFEEPSIEELFKKVVAKIYEV